MSTSASRPNTQDQIMPLAMLGVMAAVLCWSYWNTIVSIAQAWERPQYSHGYIVPMFAAFLLWLRYEPVREASAGERWIGVGILAIGLALRLVTAFFSTVIPEMATLPICLIGVFTMVGGLHMLRWSWPALAFLVFMLPFPDFVERGLLDPLQNLATRMSTFALQTLGFACYSEGNRIQLGDLQMGVVDACSGLRMLTIFFALATAITLVTERPLWERIVIVISAVPIAIVVNVIRITVTGVLYRTTSQKIADAVFHDLAGWVMMPMALGLLYVELQLLSHLWVEDTAEPVQPLSPRPTPPAARRLPT